MYPLILSFHLFSQDPLHAWLHWHQMPLLSESYLLTSSVFLWRHQTVYLNLPLCLWCMLSFLTALLLSNHHPAFISLLRPPYIVSWVPTDFLLLKGESPENCWLRSHLTDCYITFSLAGCKVPLPPPSRLLLISHEALFQLHHLMEQEERHLVFWSGSPEERGCRPQAWIKLWLLYQCR